MVTGSKGSVVVDPSSFQRSAGLTGGGTMSWQLAPAPVDGAAESEALLSAARGLGGALRGPRPVAARGYATSAALILSDGVITTETSLRTPADPHPLLSAFLSETASALLRRGQGTGQQSGHGSGHGRCVESALLSDRLYRIEERWSAEGRPGDDLRTHVFRALRGAMLTVRQIGDASGRPHGALRPPCRVCQTLLPALGIAVTGAAGWDPAPRPAPVAAPSAADMRSTDTVLREWLLGAPFTAEGTGTQGLSQVTQRLLDAGAGATALVLVTWRGADGGAHLLTAANRDGEVLWLDRHEASAEPPYRDHVDGVWSILPDADGPPPPVFTTTRFDPANPTAHHSARLNELRLLAAAYPDAGTDARVALRAEVAALVDDLELPPGTSGSNGRFAGLPPDLAAALLALCTPMPTPPAVAAVLAADPARLSAPQRAWQRDFADRLAGATDDLADRLHRLAVAGESAPASVPRLPAYAGRVIGLPPDRLSVLRELDAAVADTAAATGIYVDLTGRPDLTPYAHPGTGPIRLADPGAGFDLATDAGRAALRDADRRRARAGFRTAHGGDPATLALLGSHDFHYVGAHRPGEAREMALVPDLVAAAVRAISPVLPPPAEPPQRPPRHHGPQPQAEPPAANGTAVGRAPVVVPVQREPAPAEAGFAYYALSDHADRPTGLLVVAVLPDGPRTRRWEADGARSAGSPQPVGRERAEEISMQVFGVELPSEESLPEVLRG